MDKKHFKNYMETAIRFFFLNSCNMCIDVNNIVYNYLVVNENMLLYLSFLQLKVILLSYNKSRPQFTLLHMPAPLLWTSTLPLFQPPPAISF